MRCDVTPKTMTIELVGNSTPDSVARIGRCISSRRYTMSSNE
jgi:hypothetical protein